MLKLNSEMKAGTDAATVTDVQVNHVSQTIAKPRVSGSADDFERDLFLLINSYVNAGLNKERLCHKMRYVTISCERS